jgi:hypothetical protein
MAMAREQQKQNMGQRQIQTLEDQRRRVEDLAHSLREQANEQWRKAIEGLVALPAAITVGVAASSLYFVGFVTRGLEVFQMQALDASQRMQQQLDRGRDFGERGERGERGELERGEERGRDERPRGELGRPEMPTA